MLDAVKKQVHIINNKLQIIISYLELGNYMKALTATRDAIKEARILANMLTGVLAAVPVDRAVIVAPPNVTIVRPEEVEVVLADDTVVDIPPNVVAIVPKEALLKKKRRYKPRGPKLPGVIKN